MKLPRLDSFSVRPMRLMIVAGAFLAGVLPVHLVADEIMTFEVKDYGQTRLLFSHGPKCTKAAPSIHAYSLEQQRFLGGDELDPDLAGIAQRVHSRSDPGQNCPASVPQDRLEQTLGHALPSSERLVLFFFDLPGVEPFEHFPERAKDRREQVLRDFMQVQDVVKVHLRMSDFHFQ